MKNVVRPKGQPAVQAQGRNPAEQYLRVGVRIRPMSETEIQSGQCAVFVANEEPADTIYHSDPSAGPEGGTAYQYDKIFKDASNRTVYDGIARDIVQSSLEGINGTVFAYGQTSTGKTHTMYGSRGESGIIPLAINELFDRVNSDTAREFVLRVSYLEIYNETLRDLLNPTGTDNLKIYLSLNREVCVANLTEQVVVSPQDAHEWLEKGESNRRLASTEMNERSSRSHTIFRLIIEGKDRDPVEGDLAVKRAVLNLVDLAGSERASHTGAEGARLREGGNINKSLLALSTVISKLGDATADHVPFRDSKLTRILQTSLGGNARTAIICTITPASNYAEDTTSTLKFALRAKNVRVQPSVNEILNEDALVIRQKREITNLAKQLAAATDELQVLKSQAGAASCEKRCEESPDSKKDESKPRRKTWGPGPPDDSEHDVKPPPPPATDSASPTNSAADAEAEKTALKRDIEERDARIAELEKDIEKTRERLNDSELANDELTEQFRNARSHLDVAKQACAVQGNNFAQAKAERDQLAADLEEREREACETKARLERDVEELRENAHAHAARFEEERQRTAAHMRQVEAALRLEQQKYQQLAAEAESSSVRAKELEERERGAAAAKTVLEREVEQLNEQLNEGKMAIASLTQEREALQRERQKFEQLAAVAEAKESAKAGEMEERDRETAENKARLERDVAELAERLKEEQQATAVLQAALQQEREKGAQFAAEAESKERKLEEHEREAAEKNSRLEALSAALQQEREKGEQLADEAERMMKGSVRAGELAERELQLEERERQLEERGRQGAETTALLQRDVAELSECLEVARQALIAWESRLQQEQKKCAQLANETEVLQKELGRAGELQERERGLDERERELEERERETAETKRQVEELAERLEYERQAMAAAREAALEQQREKDEQLAAAEAALQQERKKGERLAAAEAVRLQENEKGQQLLPAEAEVSREESARAKDSEESERGTATEVLPERDAEKLAELREEARQATEASKEAFQQEVEKVEARVAEMADENGKLAERATKAEQDIAEKLRSQENQFHELVFNLQVRLAETEARNRQLIMAVSKIVVRKVREHLAQPAETEQARVIALALAAAAAREAPREPAQAQPARIAGARRAAEGKWQACEPEEAPEIALAAAAAVARKVKREPPAAQTQSSGIGRALREAKRKRREAEPTASAAGPAREPPASQAQPAGTGNYWRAAKAEPLLSAGINRESVLLNPVPEAARRPPASRAQPAGTADIWRAAKAERQPAEPTFLSEFNLDSILLSPEAEPLWLSDINLAFEHSPARKVDRKSPVAQALPATQALPTTQARSAVQARPEGTSESAAHPAEPGNRKRSHLEEDEPKEQSTRNKRSRQ